MLHPPKFLELMQALIHGDTPSRNNLLLVHFAGLVFAGELLVAFASRLSWFQAAVLFALGWDMAGGLVANVTRSTNDWYAVRPGWVGLIFVVVHIFQPGIVLLAFPQANPAYFLGLYAFMLVGVLLVLRFRRPALQKPLAMAWLAGGFLLFSLFPAGEAALGWFAPVYLTKLVYGFAVDHFAAERPQA
jgi:hypothetical protein